MSGVWERLIRSVKKAMKGVLGNPNALINQETLRTVFADVVTILNSRPLCSVSEDPKDLEPLLNAKTFAVATPNSSYPTWYFL